TTSLAEGTRGVFVIDCSNNGAISSSGDAAGIVGDSAIISIKDCYNNASVTASNYAGGIVAECSDTDSSITWTTSGTIIINGDNGAINGKYAGALAGRCLKSIDTSSLDNKGDITSTQGAVNEFIGLAS
nr:hypothetical protein [Bacilli bacterium]